MNNNVLLVWDRMGDYHRARWAALQKVKPDINVYGADLGLSDALYRWKNTEQNPFYFQLSSKPPDQIDLGRIIRFVRLLSSHKIGTICISGYGKFEYLIFILYGKLSKRRVILFAESWYRSGFIVDKLKSIFLHATCHGFLVSGRRAFEHFTKCLKISAEKIYVGYSVVDNEHFRNSGTVTFHKRILCVARFAPEKNLQLLINAFTESQLSKINWELCIVGGGPLKPTLEALIGNNANVKLLDWKSYQELPLIYHSADIFILPSIFEPWGLVVNEAMAAGLPVILSDAVGCTPDLLLNGQNGWLFSPDKNDLVQLLDVVSGYSAEVFSEMGKSSEKAISGFSVETFSNNLKLLIDTKI